MRKQILILVVVLLVVVGLGFVLFKFGPSNTTPITADQAKLVRGDSNMSGSKDAKVTLVEFGDYECPYCGTFNAVTEKLMSDYKGNKNFNFVFRNFPLSQHQWAQMAAQATEASGSQGKYWEMHNKIYDNQSQWSASNNALDIFASFAQDLGLDINKFKNDVQNNKFSNKINEDTNDATALGVNSTPTLFLNGKKLDAPPSYDSLKAQIEAELKK